MGRAERIQALRDEGEQISWDFSKIESQAQFLEDMHEFQMVSGSFSTGKTTVLVSKVIWLLTAIPNNLGYLGRLDGKALKASTLQNLYEMLPEKYFTKNEQMGFLKMRPQYGGSKLLFGDFKDIYDLKNLPLGFFAIDQCEEIPFEVWDYLVGRLRRRIPILTEEGKRQYWVIGKCPVTNYKHKGFRDVKTCLLCGAQLPKFDDTLPRCSQADRKLPPEERIRRRAANLTRIRPWDLIVYPRFGMGACNPEGPSHWIFKNFPGLPGKNGTISGPGMPGYKAFHSDLYEAYEAGIADESYVSALEIQYRDKEAMRDRYIFGLWVEAEGLVYPDWNRSLSVLRRNAVRYDGEPIIKSDASVWEYIDHGSTSPTAVGWLVIQHCECGCDRDDYFLILEHYEARKTVGYHSQCIKAKRGLLGLPLNGTYLDSQAFSKILMGQKETPREDELYSIADEFIDNDIQVIPTQKDWDVGYDKLTNLLTPDPSHVHPVLGTSPSPHFYVYEVCKDFIAEIEGYKWKKVKPHQKQNQEPIDKDDHHMDGINGFLASRPGSASAMAPEAVIEKDPAWVNELDMETVGASSHMAL